MWVKIQRNYLPILSGLIFVFVLVVLAVEIDRQVYQGRKRLICTRNFERICPQALTEKLEKYAEGYFTCVDRIYNLPLERVYLTMAGEERSRLMQEIESLRTAMDYETSRIVNQDNCLVSVSVFLLQDREKKPIREQVVSNQVDKYKRYNTFANSLVLRRFSGETALPYAYKHPPYQRFGEVVLRYTTPLGVPEIERLTSRYRLYLATVVLALGLLYWAILRHLIMPIQIVTEHMNRSKGTMPKVLPQPRTMLEAAYNDLARDALLNAVTRTMAEHMSVDRLVSREEILSNMPDLIAPNFGFATVYTIEIAVGAGSDGHVSADYEPSVRWCRAALHDRNDVSSPQPTDGDWLALGRRFDRDWDQAILDFSVADHGKNRPYFAVPITTDHEQGRVTFLAATPLGPLTSDNLRWNRETLLRLAHVIRAGLETLDMQRNLIVREKSKASISLSRNLGHDLTNVIATSKLDLDTVWRFLHLPLEQQANPNSAGRTLFTESLQGLLNNTKFLQEIINIYRSFSFLRHPQYERVDPNNLVDEVVELFQLSLSRRVRIQRSYGNDVPLSYFEPRLLKLAVFNLLTNATDALKRRAIREGDFSAALWVTTTYDDSSQTITISVRDNGCGIRNAHGELATSEEIRTLFREGFTTKVEGIAEGLGLNWVRQIVQDFHRGHLRARNHPEGGAEVSFVLPRQEVPPDTEGVEGAAEEKQAPAANEPQAVEGKLG